MENIVDELAYKKDFKTIEKYIEIENTGEFRYELVDGKINTINGASLNHNRIVSTLIGEIGNFVKGKGYQLYASRFRLNIPSADAFTYPDISIVHGKTELAEHYFDSLLNPSVIIEVVSPPTESYDRGNKLFTYLQIASLKEYILIDSTSVKIQAITKKDDGLWKFENITDLNALLAISTIGQQLPLVDIYEGVTF
jgi:Uma2 family endonuclease